MTRERSDTGYEGPFVDEEGPLHQTWRVEEYKAGYSSSQIAHVMCNNEVRGVIRCDSKEELEWLMKNFKGERRASENAPKKEES